MVVGFSVGVGGDDTAVVVYLLEVRIGGVVGSAIGGWWHAWVGGG